MDSDKKTGSGSSSILKKLERYLSLKGHKRNSGKSSKNMFRKSKSWGPAVAPSGCFSVYVGPEKQRFVIKTEYANHPMFRMLLEDAELEYGYASEGPLLLPCEVDLFCKILAEMDTSGNKEDEEIGFGHGGCSPFVTPARRSRSYGLLTPPRLLKINQF